MNIFSERIQNLKMQMTYLDVDLVSITTAPNLRYFCGFVPHLDERFNALLISQKEVIWIAPELNLKQIEANGHFPIITWRDDEGPEKAIREALHIVGSVRSLAIDGGGRADTLLHLQSIAKPLICQSADEMISFLRQIKSEDEIEKLTLAAAQADRAIKAGIQACKPGVSEREIAWEVESFFRQDGAEQVDFTLIASGPNGAFPHHHYSERVLQNGDAIILDIGATLNGYKSDITRMVFLGNPPKEFLFAYEVIHQANLRTRQMIAPGRIVEEIDRAARDYLREKDLGEYFIHRTGHGIGLDVHEQPWIMEGNSTHLQPGMTFSIEPGVYFVGKFGIRIEDIVTVTKHGVQVLTQFTHELNIK